MMLNSTEPGKAIGKTFFSKVPFYSSLRFCIVLQFLRIFLEGSSAKIDEAAAWPTRLLLKGHKRPFRGRSNSPL